jgi:hypothetical protein
MNNHVVHNSSDPNQIANAQDWQEDRDRDLDYIIQSPRGRRWLHSLIHDYCNVERRSHVPGDHDSTAFNEGARSVGLALVDQIKNRDYGKYIEMLKEADGGN